MSNRMPGGKFLEPGHPQAARAIVRRIAVDLYNDGAAACHAPGMTNLEVAGVLTQVVSAFIQQEHAKAVAEKIQVVDEAQLDQVLAGAGTGGTVH